MPTSGPRQLEMMGNRPDGPTYPYADPPGRASRHGASSSLKVIRGKWKR